MSIEWIKPHVRDLGGFSVKRLLPAHPRKLIGPFIFFDHMGPAEFAPGQGMDVRPHPHIGLATVTYLFEGAMLHRDSLGSVQRIAPGDVNWMTAGRGIVHSERSAPEDRARGQRVHGIQTWVALPIGQEDAAPAFTHHPRSTLPVLESDGVSMRVVAGSFAGLTAPTLTHPLPAADLLYVAIETNAGTRFTVPGSHPERGLYLLDGSATLDGVDFPLHHLAWLPPGREIEVRCGEASRLMLLGGAPYGDRFIHWNFVAPSQAAIEAARAAWQGYPNAQFPHVPGETEFIPLPG